MKYILIGSWWLDIRCLELAGLATFHALEGWVNKMFLALTRQVPQGYRPVNIQQLIAADRALFIRAADALVGGLSGVPGRAKPLDEQVAILQDSPEIVQYMTPLQGSTDSKRPYTPGDPSAAPPEVPCARQLS